MIIYRKTFYEFRFFLYLLQKVFLMHFSETLRSLAFIKILLAFSKIKPNNIAYLFPMHYCDVSFKLLGIKLN